MHPAIRLASATRLDATDAGCAAPAPTPTGSGRSPRDAVRRVGGRVLDRIGRAYAESAGAAATQADLDALRAELIAARAELGAEIELLRTELEAGSDRPNPPRPF